MILNLSQKLIDTNLEQYISGRRTELVSDERSGLYIELRETCKDAGTFYIRFKDSTNKTCHKKLGRTNEISLADARKKVIEFKAALVSCVVTPKPEVNKKEEMTLNTLWSEYFDFAKSTKRSWKRDEQLWRIRIKPRFGHLKLSEITVRQIQKLMMDVRTEGLSGASADHHGQLMRRLGNVAVKWNYLDVNFARGIQLYHEFNMVENIPDDMQLQRLLQVLKTDENREICLLVQFLLVTGARRSEAVNMKFSDVSIEQKLWTVPHQSSKSKRPRSIPLNESALEVLAMIERKPGDIYVFANPETGKPFVSVFKPWARIRKQAGIPDCRLHDLRHAYASMCVNNGCSLYQVSQLLGHADTRVTQRYAHLNTTTMLAAANSVTQKLSSLMYPKLLEDKSKETV